MKTETESAMQRNLLAATVALAVVAVVVGVLPDLRRYLRISRM
ncbi:DUF6893 family small protein [Streptomyces tanashiensis]|nr:hypothetical protein [Streptomyces tanashiensis]GGY09102.1 hypothetical protein GCM10010299_10780 [Streptomyces tanashiensis]